MFDSLKERFENIFSSLRGKGKLSEEDINLALREVRRALLEADVALKSSRTNDRVLVEELLAKLLLITKKQSAR